MYCRTGTSGTDVLRALLMHAVGARADPWITNARLRGSLSAEGIAAALRAGVTTSAAR